MIGLTLLLTAALGVKHWYHRHTFNLLVRREVESWDIEVILAAELVVHAAQERLKRGEQLD